MRSTEFSSMSTGYTNRSARTCLKGYRPKRPNLKNGSANLGRSARRAADRTPRCIPSTRILITRRKSGLAVADNLGG